MQQTDALLVQGKKKERKEKEMSNTPVYMMNGQTAFGEQVGGDNPSQSCKGKRKQCPARTGRNDIHDFFCKINKEPSRGKRSTS